jgi:hypothetical protein
MRLTKEQAAALAKSVAEHQQFFYLLRERMRKMGIHHDDMTFLMVSKIYDSLTELKMHAHYLSCDGVG